MIGDAISAPTIYRSPDPALDLVVECAHTVVPRSDVCLALVGPDGNSLSVGAAYGQEARQLVIAAAAEVGTGPNPLTPLHVAVMAADPDTTAIYDLILRSGRAAGALVIAGDDSIAERDRSILAAMAAQAALTMENARIYDETQRSFNHLFIAYEAGRLFNFSQGLEEVLQNTTAILSRALQYRHYAVLLREGEELVPGASWGLAPPWRENSGARIPLTRSFARRVMEGGMTEQEADPAVLAELVLPLLEDGLSPRSVLCAPMTTRAGTLGVIELYDATRRRYTSDEEFLLSVLANEAAGAVENARLYESLRDKESRLTMFAQKLVHSQEEERKRLARDIHDGLAQMIVAAYRYLQAHQYTHRDEDFTQGLTILHDCIGESRKVMSDLRPSVLDDFGLVLALEQYVATLATEVGWQADYSVQGGLERLPPVLETTIFRLVQEALTNVRKHAAAPQVLVQLEQRGDQVFILVRDFGGGFDPHAVRAAADGGTSHLGLVGMRERVALAGGIFSLQSSPGEGTTVTIMLPIEQQEAI